MKFESPLERLLGRVRTTTRRSSDSFRIVGIEVAGDRSALICRGDAGTTTIVVPQVPSGGHVDRWRRVMRVDRIEIEFDDDVRASIIGVSHRLPTRRTVPLAVALGLVDGGSPGRVLVFDAEPVRSEG